MEFFIECIDLATSQAASTQLTLKTLEEKTPLVRCHRQYLVSIKAISEIKLLTRDGQDVERFNMLNPESEQKTPYITSVKFLYEGS